MPEVLFDLASNRTILLHDRGRVFTITCRPPSPADWFAYFAAISITSERTGAEVVNTIDIETPRVLLAERVIVAVEGYKLSTLAFSAAATLTDLPNWQSRLPLAHRRQVGETLADVRVSMPTDDNDFLIQPEGEEVTLDATYSVVDGKMVRLTGLKHIFKSPTQAQHKRYNGEASRSVVTGGSRNGRTVYTGAQKVLCQLWDELIVGVEGYAVNHPKPDDMDLHHKFTAAQELFAPTSTVTTEASEAE